MALLLPACPESSIAVVHSSLGSFFSRLEGPPPALAASAPDRLRVELPHPVFHLGLSEVAAGEGLNHARMTGWRYLLADGDDVLAAIEVEHNLEEDVHRFSSLNQGPFVGETWKGFERLKAQGVVAEGSFTFAVLRIPALYIVAFWLRSEIEGEDLVVPMRPTHHALVAERIYPASEFLAALREAARQRQSSEEDLTA